MWIAYTVSTLGSVFCIPVLLFMLLWWHRERRLNHRLKTKTITFSDFSSYSLLRSRRRKEYWGIAAFGIGILYTLSVVILVISLEFFSWSLALQFLAALTTVAVSLFCCSKGWCMHIGELLNG